MKLFRDFNIVLAALAAAISVPAGSDASVPSGKTDINIRPVVQMEGAAEVWLHGGIESWDGDITYKIGFPVTLYDGTVFEGYFPFSELKFPIDTVFSTITMNSVFRDKFLLDATLKKNLSSPDSNMEDRDWITESDTNRLDVYSESKITDLNAWIIDVDLGYKVLRKPQGWLAGGIGYMYQYFDFETAVIRQWSPSGLDGFDYTGDGTVSLNYEAKFYMPYFLISGQYNPVPKIFINGKIAISPKVEVKDRDQHILRYKENIGDMDGHGVMISLNTRYDLNQRWFLTAGFTHTYIDVDGDMDASFYGIYDHTVTEELTSDQTSVYLTAGYRFGPMPNENGDKNKL